MHASTMPYYDRWSDRCGKDGSLKKLIAEARQEFSGLTDEEVKDTWSRLQSILIGWAQESGESLPQYQTHFPRPGNNLNAYSHGAPTNEIDYIFLFFLASRYQPLVTFLNELAPQPLMSLRKAFALMILREAEEQNYPEIKRLMRSFERVLQ
jgi:hypothetical protein